MERKFISTAKLAERWDVHPNTIYRQVEQGIIPAPVRIGKQLRHDLERIERFERNTRQEVA